jgi:hypothetical protein
MSNKLIILTEEAFTQIIEKLNSIESLLLEKTKIKKPMWLDNQEFMQLLKISSRTAQNYRDKNMISFSLIGNKLYYKLSDVEDLLERFYHKRTTKICPGLNSIILK